MSDKSADNNSQKYLEVKSSKSSDLKRNISNDGDASWKMVANVPKLSKHNEPNQNLFGIEERKWEPLAEFGKNIKDSLLQQVVKEKLRRNLI